MQRRELGPSDNAVQLGCSSCTLLKRIKLVRPAARRPPLRATDGRPERGATGRHQELVAGAAARVPQAGGYELPLRMQEARGIEVQYVLNNGA